MHVALVAGSDAGHAFPAFALAERCVAAGHRATVYTGLNWSDAARRRGIDIAGLPGLAATDVDDDADAGDKLSARAARMAQLLAPVLSESGTDLVVSDVITVCGGWAAELVGLPWIELSPHPLYLPSRGLPPIGSGLAPGTGIGGRLRDTLMRAATATSIRRGERQRAAARESIGLPAVDDGPYARFVATLPGLEVPRPDWPADTHLIGPLLWEPTDDVFDRPDGDEPLVVLAPSTAETGAPDMVGVVLEALSERVLGRRVREVVSGLRRPSADDLARFGFGDDGSAPITVGLGRQDEVLADAQVLICGSGHGILAKAMTAGVPVVAVPGGGDQWELANRLQRAGAGRWVRPLTVDAVADAVRTVLDDPEHTRRAQRIGASGADTVDPVTVMRRRVVRCA
ncbi:glycosyltransferase [Gordonia westfalica]|uniref:UDP:flavonoid glycosyltransferase YjiC, YdhE family n=1 Tax=Gordonia westfalica TaxID=158898 RepID=A0A1H2HXF2_9ACTN|nr:nucleotide disphospho-sugar-binding domain-containing protein [Gordonia westfalica]SDU36218.1 UDP:flavonoid glycosyltransferase YjiC, YdhE family [Gordonia westfalica]